MLCRLILAAVCLSGLAACEADMANYDYREQFPINVETRIATLILDPGPGGQIKAENAAAVAEFAADYNKRSAGNVNVVIGANSGSDPLATSFARDIHRSLVARGIPSGAIEMAFAVDAESAKYGRAEMHFPIYVALANECGTFKDQPGFTPLNENTYGFGCANQRNLAAMVVNPRDLVDAQEPSGRLAVRANDVVGKYIIGVPAGARATEVPPLMPFDTNNL